MMYSLVQQSNRNTVQVFYNFKHDKTKFIFYINVGWLAAWPI